MATGEPVMEFRILGPLEVLHDNRPVPLRGTRERAVLAVLLVAANRVVSVDRLVEELWGGTPPDGAVRAVRVFVSRIRKALHRPDAQDVVITAAPGYLAQVAPLAIDASRFEALVAQGRERADRGDHHRAAELFGQALAHWRGPALADVAVGPLTRGAAARLEEARLTVVEERLDAQLFIGRHVEVVAELEALTASHPLRERLWGQRMLALYRSGRQSEALRAYQDARRILGELGLEPASALADLERAILRHDPELNLHVTPAAPATPEITLVFSDIEASTRRWEGDPTAMARDLALHDELVRDAFAAADGEVFAHTGDGQCAAFTTPAAAFHGAVAAQRALHSATWSSQGPLLVRMAIHAGVVERRANNYFGPPLNRAGRLLAVAAGGQILCSQAAADQVGSDLPVGLTLIDLGEHRLADLAKPERVFQVQHPELPSRFPPLRSLGVIRHNLPAMLSAFVGRAVECDELTDLIKRSRLVSLLGVGGAGKTRLAIQVAGAALDLFPDGVWFVDLAPIRDDNLVPSTVAEALRLAPMGLERADQVLEHVCTGLSTKRMLLIFDNCEHLIWPTARVIHAVLAACPQVSVLATSRETLGLPGEVTWRVPPLSLPPPDPADPTDLAGSDAVWLFLERARSARPGFALSDANVKGIAGICRRLDGIPLAIELAAARLRAFSVERVAAGLDDCFRTLTGGPRTAVARHQTLRAALDWSYGLLDSDEDDMLCSLAVFPAAFDVDAAEAVAGPVGDAAGTLARLVDKSLVVASDDHDDIRYRLLDPVRQYAAERLDARCDTQTARRRHHDHFRSVALRWAATLRSELDWPLRDVAAEADNLRSALEWAWSEGDTAAALDLVLAQSQFWLWGGRFEGCDWCQRVVDDARRRGIRMPWLVLADLAYMLVTFGRSDPATAEALLEEAVGAAEGDAAAVATAQWALGAFEVGVGKLDHARDLLETAAAAFVRLGEPEGLGWAEHDLGWVDVARGDFDSARSHFDRAAELAVAARLGPFLAPHVLSAAAPITALHDSAHGRHLAEEAVSAARLLPTPLILVMTLARSAETAIICGDHHHAAATVSELLRLVRDLQARRWTGDALEMVAVLAAAENRDEQAAALFGTACRLREALGEPLGGLRILAGRVRDSRVAVQRRLGPHRFAECEDRGRGASTADGIAAALAVVADIA
jgi:predicted ATPase/DNA-binding SARP family transcriptional activator